MNSLFPDVCTDDLARSRDFYRDLLGFEVIFENAWYVQLHHPEQPAAQIAFVLREHASVPKAFRARPQGVLVTVELDDVDACHARARALGLELAYELVSDEPVAAEALLDEALRVMPEYHSALAALSEVHLRMGRAVRALELADRSLAAAPHAERYLIRADALRALGRDEEARAAEHAFERAALANVSRADNENNHLVDFYLERRPDPERALEIARAEAKRRPDAPTLERLARALERNGLVDEARALRGNPG